MSPAVAVRPDTTSILSQQRHFNWGAVIAGAFAAAAVSFFFLTLGAGIGLAAASPWNTTSGAATTFLTLGAIYFLAVQAFSFAVGGYLVGRLIGPEVENSEEEEFRAAAHGFVMWALAIVAGLLLAWFASTVAGSAIYASTGTNRSSDASSSGYWTDTMFRPAANTPAVVADKTEAGRILTAASAKGGNIATDDSTRLAQMISQDAGMPLPAAQMRVTQVQNQMRQDADTARKAASALSLWVAFALLLGAVVAIAAAISSRWMDDRVTFSLARRRR